jgi:hypothetical protein
MEVLWGHLQRSVDRKSESENGGARRKTPTKTKPAGWGCLNERTPNAAACGA